MRSAAIVARGLREPGARFELAGAEGFHGTLTVSGIPPAGQIATVSSWVRQGAERMTLYDIDRSFPSVVLASPGRSSCAAAGPARRVRVVSYRAVPGCGVGRVPPELHIFDLQSKMLLGGFGEFASFPSAAAWSDDGNILLRPLHEAAMRPCVCGPLPQNLNAKSRSWAIRPGSWPSRI